MKHYENTDNRKTYMFKHIFKKLLAIQNTVY